VSKHNFRESTDKFGEFHRVIYCTHCGRVVWDFNKNEKSDLKQSELQSYVGESCVASDQDEESND
jgi:ABC-type uncharacterized transport system ATPase component